LDAEPAVEDLQILYREGLSMKAHGNCKPLHEGVLTEKDRPGRAPGTHEANFVFPLDVVILITARREKAYADVHEPNPNVVAAHTEHEAAVGRSGFDANGVGEVRCCQDVAGPGIYEGISRVTHLDADEGHTNNWSQYDSSKSGPVFLVLIDPWKRCHHRRKSTEAHQLWLGRIRCSHDSNASDSVRSYLGRERVGIASNGTQLVSTSIHSSPTAWDLGQDLA
jgi:hypothetical protein